MIWWCGGGYCFANISNSQGQMTRDTHLGPVQKHPLPLAMKFLMRLVVMHVLRSVVFLKRWTRCVPRVAKCGRKSHF